MKMSQMLLSVVLACLTLCGGYELGAPLESCTAMFPTGHSAYGQTSTAPYTLTLNTTTYSPNAAVEITLTATSDKYFEGFFIQARLANCSGATAIGSFSSPDSDVKLLTCPGSNSLNNAITHSNENKRTVKKFIWTNTGSEDVFFKATIVHKLAEFWTDVTSEYVYEATKQSTPSYSACGDGSNNHNHNQTTRATVTVSSISPSMSASANGPVSTTVGTNDASNTCIGSTLMAVAVMLMSIAL